MNIENAVNIIFQSIGIPVCVTGEHDEILISPHGMDESVYFNNFTAECRHEYLKRSTADTLPTILSFAPSLLAGVIVLKNQNLCILGPVKSTEYSTNNSNIGHNSNVEVIHYLRFAGLMALAFGLITGEEIRPDEIIFVSTSTVVSAQASESILVNNIFANRETYDFHTPTSFETTVMDAISAGDAAELKRRLSDPLQGKVGQMSADVLRQHKYLFVAIATMVSRAAIRGGMDEEISRSLFDTYCMQMDDSENVQDIVALAYKMAFDFCEKVASHLGNSQYSPAIKKCVTYISRHLHEDIKLTDLALACRTSTRGISKKFRAETGMAVSDFIHRKKMREACYLLKYTDYSISEIGNILQYNTQSYFTKVFHDIYDTTPKQYRDNAHIS